MGNNKNKIYAIILIVSTILFVAGMVTCIFGMNFTFTPGKVTQMATGNSQTVNKRLNDLDSYVEKNGPEVIYNELYYGHSYEPEFDDYWEFADIQIAAIRGRFADDKTKYRQIIEAYISNCDDAARKEAAETYLEQLN